MNAPRPENFGISADSLPAIRDEQEKLANWDARIGCLIFLVVYGVVVVGYWPALGPLGLFFGAFLSAFVGLLLCAGFHYGRPWLMPAGKRRRIASYAAYVQAQQEYDAWFLRTQTAFWRSLDGLAFEREVAHLLTQTGLPVRLTSPSDDKGIDLILGDGSIVQCKQRKSPVGPAVVRELYGALMASGAPRAILISTNGFTPGVHEFATGKPIELWDHSVLIRMQRTLGQ